MDTRRFKYQLIAPSRADEIAKLAVCLTSEIIERTGVKHFEVDVSQAIALCRQFIAKDIYKVIAAFAGDTVVGFAALCESHALYAEGAFGIIQEFYVMPEFRSQAVGGALLQEAIKLAKANAWTRLELCTPPVPEFDRTVDFYHANGFAITGGYKMKYVISGV